MCTICFLRYKPQYLLLLLTCALGEINSLYGQIGSQPTITVAAGKQYNTSKSHQSRWGKHYRKEWATPVNFQVAMLDTLAGGLTPYQEGGGRQSKSLRLKDANGREWVLRSIDKSFGKALPEVARGTFIEDIANDQVSIAHPYSGITIPAMASAAKILHTIPRAYYIPKQPALGKFNEEYGDILYTLEQRPDENWETAANFGNSTNIISTENLLERLEKDNDNRVDQLLYVRSRLFDFFIGDWGRHEDQWRWASFKSDGETLYKPIPRDRDQTYTKFDGFLVGLFKGMAADHLQSFGPTIKDVTTFNFPARNLDRRMANEVTLEQWVTTAKDLQQLLTDAVIENSVKQMPPEVFPISGDELISNLKSRRGHLEAYARTYYLFIAKEVDIPGSKDTELFEVKRGDDGSTAVNIYKITNEGKTKKKPFYSRVFHSNETSEIRIYGLGAADKYEVTGKAGKGTLVRLIGGQDKDEYNDASSVNGGSRKTIIYDNPGNALTTGKETRVHLSSDTAVNAYRYQGFTYDKKGIQPLIFYSNEDRIYVGLQYGITRHGWRKEPYASKQKINVKYSLTEKGFSSTYEGQFVEALGKLDLNLYGNYDQVRWYNYYGLGNESKNLTPDRVFNRLRTKEVMGKLGFSRRFANFHKISLGGFYQSIAVKNDSVFDKTLLPVEAGIYNTDQFGGAVFEYSFQSFNDSLLPTKGFGFSTAITYTDNLQNRNNFMRYAGVLKLYLPFTKTLGLVSRVGGATLTGDPEFYQYNAIGGGSSLRGYHRTRFFGKSSFYTQQELRWVKDVKGYLYSGKFGLMAIYDIGRVWMPGENSNSWHSGAGGAIILAPFNLISLTGGYARSVEGGNFFFKVLKIF